MRLADRYRLERQVGEGGGGGVFLVRDRLADDAPMVLKRLHAHANAGVAQWLVNEFQVLAQLDMPTVARVFDFGLAESDADDPGGAFFTREFVDGVPLDQAVGPVPDASRVVELFASAAEALHTLHRLGVVHGDLKPANLIVPREGDARVVLIDFGLAHGALGAADRIRGGTLAFMPPERRDQLVLGEALAPDPRADLYSLAVSLLVTLGFEPGVDDGRAVDPSLAALVELGRRGAHADPSQRFATADDLLAALTHGTRAPRSTRVVLRPEGREAELGSMLEHVARRLVRREGGAGSVLLSGGAGSGRSTLLRELAWRAQLRGVQVLQVQGEPGDEPARRLRDGARVLASSGTAPVDDAEALSAALRRAARTAPVLVIADDLDRADPAIAARLRSIAYSFEAGEPLLVVASAVDDVPSFDPGARVTLGPLDETAVAALCEQILGPVEPGVVAAVQSRSGGTALAVGEILRALAGTGGVTAADVARVEASPRARDVARRLAGSLSGSSQQVAAAVVALGGSSEPARVARVAALDAAQVARARGDGAVVLRADGRLALAQSALADVVFDAIGDVMAVAIHRRAAEEINVDPDAPATARVLGWIGAGDASRAVGHLDAAVSDLRASGMTHAAADLYARIRALDPAEDTPARRLDEAVLRHDSGDHAQAARVAESVIGTGDRRLSQRARLIGGRALSSSGDPSRAKDVLEAGLADAGDDRAERAEFLAALAWRDLRSAAFADAARRADEALTLAEAPALRATLLCTRGLALGYQGEHRAAVEPLERAIELFASTRTVNEEARALSHLAQVHYQAGDLAAAKDLWEKSLERARACGELDVMASARLNLGSVLDVQGDLAGALDHFSAAARLAKRAGVLPHALGARLNTAGVLVRLGSHERARLELEALLTSARAAGYNEITAFATELLGVVRARGGDVTGGLALLDEAREAFASMGHGEYVAGTDYDAAEVLIDRQGEGDLARASELLARARATRPDDPAHEARARTLEARVMLARGDARGAQTLLAEAAELAERANDRDALARALSVRARAHHAMGAALHARRDRERALEVLESTAALLPPDLRSAFWSVPERAALRAPTTGSFASDGYESPSVAFPSREQGPASTAPTLIAQDQRLMLLLELSRRVGEEQTLSRVLDLAARSAVELTHGERGSVLLVGADGVLEVRSHTGRSREDAPDESFSRSIAESALIDGEVVTTHNARGDRRFADFRSVHELSIGAVAAVPIRTRGRSVGVLYVENRRRRSAWSSADMALLRAFAEQAGIAVEHARVVEELEARTRELEAARGELAELLAARTEELETTRRSLALAEEALKTRFAPAGMIAQTDAMRKVFAVIDRVRDADVPVVIEGESGTGKEMVARALHFSGARSKGPFVVVHCGAIPETLLESELFGHVKGAFTGAERDRRGLIASAHGGTLLLDEVAEMPVKMQVELLRVLQDRRVRPVGSEREELVDVRIVATSHRPLRDLVTEQRFREDLYYRLGVVTIRLPPLRARLDDIPTLATHFLERIAEDHGTGRKRLSRDAVQKLLRSPWPGNVRQLRHVLESAAVLADSDTIDAAQLTIDSAPLSVPPSAPASVPPSSASPMAVRKAAERQRILDALEQANWNKVRAATVLGMPRRTLYRRLREYGLLDE